MHIIEGLSRADECARKMWKAEKDEGKICLPDFLNSRELLILDMIRVKFLSLIWRVISSVVFDISCTSRQAVSFLQGERWGGRKRFHYYWHDPEAFEMTTGWKRDDDTKEKNWAMSAALNFPFHSRASSFNSMTMELSSFFLCLTMLPMKVHDSVEIHHKKWTLILFVKWMKFGFSWNRQLSSVVVLCLAQSSVQLQKVQIMTVRNKK